MSAGPVQGRAPTGADVEGMPAAAPGARRLSRWLLWALYAAVLVAIAAMVLFGLLALPPGTVVHVQVWLRSASHLGVMVQFVLCCWVIVQWPCLVTLSRRRGVVSKAEYREVLAMRWRAAALLAAYLLAVPIGPTRMLQAWGLVSSFF